jgi:hypothetical protein
MADHGSLVEVADGVWTDTDPVTILGTRLTKTMAVTRLGDGTTLLYSPLGATPERRAAVGRIGRVTHLYAPNVFHHLHVGEWLAAFPSARVHAPRALLKKRSDLRIDRVHGSEPEPAFDGLIDEVRIRGFRLKESVLTYRAARVLMVADLVHNVRCPGGAWTRCYTRAMGFYGRVALSRALRWTAFSDRAAARRSIDDVLALPFERIVVGHGTPIVADAKQALSDAYGWLPAAR